MSKFTQGKWIYEYNHGAYDISSVRDIDNEIATIYNISDEGEANARLIAAAPDMYDALYEVITAINKVSRILFSSGHALVVLPQVGRIQSLLRRIDGKEEE